MKQSSRKGILLMNLGSPDSTSVRDVRKYLNEFLMDERVIDVPYLWRFLLVRGMITPFRAPRSAEAYRSIWTTNGSPLIHLTVQLKEALQELVQEPVEIAMRYGNPHPKVGFERLQQRDPSIEEVILVPLYPHYAMSSYETAVEYAKQVRKENGFNFKLSVVEPFYNHEGYIHALAKSIQPHLEDEYDHLLFSYHGIPERHIHKTDITGHHCLKTETCCDAASPAHSYCYRHQIITTTHLVSSKLGIPKEKFSFSFQSRLGRDEWLKPYTATRLQQMPGEGIKKLLVVCPAFISDCLETLEEIAVEGRETFLHAGGEVFTYIPCLNMNKEWVTSLKQLSEMKKSKQLVS
jgi:ferrochelatase